MTNGMPRKFWFDFSSSLIVAAGIIVASLVAVRTVDARWVLAGPLVLAIAIVGSDVWDSRLRGGPLVPSWASLILGASVVLSCQIVASGNPSLVKSFLPIAGACGWITLRLRPGTRPRTCWGI